MGKQIITFDSYIRNPMSKENAVFSHREMYAELYKNKLDKIMVRENGEVKYKLFRNKNTDQYYTYIKIPSEIVPNFYYDVVIEFSPNGATSIGRSIKDYSVKFYSNDPSFVFTFVHAFAKHNLFIEDLKNKMSKKALNNKAKEKNPTEQIGYVKSLYFAYLIMKDRGLFEKIKYESEAEIYDKRVLLSQIEDADIKIEKRQTEGQKLTKEKKKEKNTEDKDRNSHLNRQGKENRRTLGLNIKNTNSIKNSNSKSKVNKISGVGKNASSNKLKKF